MQKGNDCYENNTRVKFDYRLKLLIQKLHTDHSDVINKLKSYDYNILQDAQKFIRNYFFINQQEINIAGRLTKNAESMPEYFSLLCAVVSDLTKCENWREIWQQYVIGVYKYAIYPDNFDVKETVICMCSHTCCAENMVIIPNICTNLHLYIACVCITKTGIVSQYEFKTKRRLNDRYAKIIYDKEILKQTKLSLQEKWVDLVSRYTEKIKKYKLCCDCEQLIIEIGSFKKRCGLCHHIEKTKDIKPKCLLVFKK
jgi:hypothetical protein